jgi:hypothetical protein
MIDMHDSKPLLGLREKRKRELEKREFEERLPISPAWFAEK